MTHMNVNVTSSGQGTRTVVLQIPRVRPIITIFLRGTFWIFSLMDDNQHCFVCCPSDSDVSEDAWIEPWTVATTALANRSARSHPLG
jgi:hypothetical protein